MTRAHLYRPIQDSQGNLVIGPSVEVLDSSTGTATTQVLYRTKTGSETYPNPFTADIGVIDFWVDSIVLFDFAITVDNDEPVVIQGVGPEATTGPKGDPGSQGVPGVDGPPGPPGNGVLGYITITKDDIGGPSNSIDVYPDSVWTVIEPDISLINFVVPDSGAVMVTTTLYVESVAGDAIAFAMLTGGPYEFDPVPHSIFGAITGLHTIANQMVVSGLEPGSIASWFFGAAGCGGEASIRRGGNYADIGDDPWYPPLTVRIDAMPMPF